MPGKRPYLFLLLILFTFGCQLVAVPAPFASTPTTAGTPLPTATPCSGCTRAHPYPRTETLYTQNWEIQVLEVVRGSYAWEALQETNLFNEPPPPGEAYLLVRYRLGNTHQRSTEKRELGLHVTGDAQRLYYNFDAGVVVPGPRLETNLAGGQSSEGWLAYRVREGEGEFMVVVHELFNFDEPVYFMALDEAAAITIPTDALESIAVTAVGQTPTEPAAPGQIVTNNTWQLTVEQIITGEEAWQMTYAANQFNEPPPAGMVYHAIYVKARYIGINDTGERIDEFDFDLLDAAGEVLRQPALVAHKPELDYHLYPGGEGAGWLIMQAPLDTANLRLTFTPGLDVDHPDTRYFSLVQYGR